MPKTRKASIPNRNQAVIVSLSDFGGTGKNHRQRRLLAVSWNSTHANAKLPINSGATHFAAILAAGILAAQHGLTEGVFRSIFRVETAADDLSKSADWDA